MNPIILYDNRFLDVPSILATDTDLNGEYNVLNIRDTRPYLSHKFSGPGTKYYTVNCGSAKESDCLGIFTHNLGSAGAQVSVESSTDNFGSVTTQRLAPVSPSNDFALLRPFTLASAPDWRIKVVTAAMAAQNSVMMLGKRLTIPGNPVGPFTPYVESITANSPMTELGSQIEATTKFSTVSITAKFQFLDRAWIENTFLPFWNNYMKKEKYFFFAWNLEDFPQHVFFVKRASGYQFQMPLSKGYRVKEFTISMEGICEF